VKPAARYDDSVFGTGPYGTGPIPTVTDPLRQGPAPAGVPLTPGAGVRASSIGLMTGTPATRDDGDGAERTRNGLRKRVRRAPLPESAIATPPPGIIRPSPHPAPPPIDDSPDGVRDRIMALRAGIERGAQQGGTAHTNDGEGRGPGSPRRTGGADTHAEEPG
jgi:hypothetical protein